MVARRLRLMPFPPLYNDSGRPGHYLSPDATLAKYAANKYDERDAAALPSAIAIKAYEQETKDAPVSAIKFVLRDV